MEGAPAIASLVTGPAMVPAASCLIERLRAGASESGRSTARKSPAVGMSVNPNVTGYTPTPSEGEWPGQFSSLMTIDKTA